MISKKKILLRKQNNSFVSHSAVLEKQDPYERWLEVFEDQMGHVRLKVTFI